MVPLGRARPPNTIPSAPWACMHIPGRSVGAIRRAKSSNDAARFRQQRGSLIQLQGWPHVGPIAAAAASNCRVVSVSEPSCNEGVMPACVRFNPSKLHQLRFRWASKHLNPLVNTFFSMCTCYVGGAHTGRHRHRFICSSWLLVCWNSCTAAHRACSWLPGRERRW